MPSDTWTLWGPVHDRSATLATVKALQAQGHRVRIVHVDGRNDIYVNELPGPEAA